MRFLDLDSTLIRSLLAHDPEAFKVAVQRLVHYLGERCLRMPASLRDEVLSEGTEIFVDLFYTDPGRAKLAELDNLGGWICVRLDRAICRLYAPPREVGISAAEDFEAPDPTPCETLAEAEVAVKLNEAVDRLVPDQKRAIVLSYADELRGKDLGAALTGERSRSAARRALNVLAKARSSVRKFLAERLPRLWHDRHEHG